MSVASNIRNVLSLNRTPKRDETAQADTTKTEIQRLNENEQAIQREVSDLTARRIRIDAERRKLSRATQELETLKTERTTFAAAALIEDKEADVEQLDRQIRAKQTEIKAIDSNEAAINAALATLDTRLGELRMDLASFADARTRLAFRELHSRLEDFAPEFREALAAFQAKLVELSALATARDRLGPKIPGTSSVGCLPELQVCVPTMPAYFGIGWFNLRKDCEARVNELYNELGVRA